MTTSLDDLLKQTKLVVDERAYQMIKLPHVGITAAAGIIAAMRDPFCALIVDPDEVTLVLPAEAWDEFSRRLPAAQVADTRFRLITFAMVFDFTVVGFMARVSAALATAQVPVFPFAAYSTDHILVPEAKLDAALSALRTIIG